MEQVIKTFEDCFVTDGYQRSILIDTNRFTFFAIPKSLSSFINYIDGKTQNDIYLKYGYNNADIIKEYFKFLYDNELIIEVDEILFDRFKPISLFWETPYFVTNIIIDFSDVLDINNILSSVKIMLCPNIEIRIQTFFQLERLLKLLDLLDDSLVGEIHLIFSDKQFNTIKMFPFDKYIRIESILVYSCDTKKNDLKNKFIKTSNLSLNELILIKEINKFTPNLQLFIESQSYNTYFNRKMYIGKNGEIKNAPECVKSFGHVQNLNSPKDLISIVNNLEFQEYWKVKKEICDVCKDCEFRHMCVDNRLPYQRKSDNLWYHNTECNYNPYIAKWKGEEGYRTLNECGVVSNEKGFSIDHERIAAINEELWGGDE